MSSSHKTSSALDSQTSRDVKSIAAQTSLYSLGNLLGKFIGFLMIPIYTHYLTPADYGVIELLTLVSSVLSVIVGMKLSTGLVRFFFKYADESDRRSLVSSQLLMLAAASAVIGTILCLYAGLFSSVLFGSPAYSAAFRIVFISMAFETINASLFTYLRILEKPLHFIGVSLVQLVTGLTLNIIFIAGYHMGVWGVLYSMIITNMLTTALLLSYCLPQIGIRFDPAKLRVLLRFSLPLLPAGILMFVLNMGDRFLLNHFAGPDAVGIYSLGYKFGMILSLFVGMPFLQIWDWKRVSIYEQHKANQILFTKIPIYLLLILAVAGLLVSVPIKEIIHAVASVQFQAAAQITPWVALGYAFYILFYVVDIGIFLRGKTYWYVVINGVAAAINLGLNFYLIPRYAALGAAVAKAVSFAVCPVMAYAVSQRYHPVTYEYGKALKIFVAALAFYWVASHVAFQTLWATLAVKLGVVLLFPVACWVLGVFDTAEIQAARRLIFPKSATPEEAAETERLQ